jgi:hypothetical protein
MAVTVTHRRSRVPEVPISPSSRPERPLADWEGSDLWWASEGVPCHSRLHGATATVQGAEVGASATKCHDLCVNRVARLIAFALVRPAPKSAEDVVAEREAARIRDEMQTIRSSTRGMRGEYYEAQRRRDRSVDAHER